MEPTTITINTDSRDKILAQLNEKWHLKHEHDDDIADYPADLQGQLLVDGYITYSIDEGGVHYRWTEGALDVLNKGTEPETIQPRPDIADNFTEAETNVRIELSGNIEKDCMTVTIEAKSKFENGSRIYCDYRLSLKKKEDGVYELYAECPNRKLPTKPLCVLTNVSEQFDSEKAAEVHWEYETQYDLTCEALGIAVHLDSEVSVNGIPAIRLVLETNTNYADTATYTLMTATVNRFLTSISYMVDKTDPLMGIYTENYIWGRE